MPSTRHLPMMSDKEYDYVIEQARIKGEDLSRCHTCGAERETPVPGVDLGWPTDSKYKYQGEWHACDCTWQDELRRHYLLANIPRGYWTYGPEEYFGDPKAWESAQGYLSNWSAYKRTGMGLDFYSADQGTGKTFLVSYVLRNLIQLGERCYYLRFREIFGLFNRPYEARRDEEDRLNRTPVLVLDEIGKPISGAQGEYFAVEFENLVRTRTDDNLVTLMTTNLLPDELDHYYPRTYSLLSAKQLRYEIHFEDARRSGDVQFLDIALAEAGEARPIV